MNRMIEVTSKKKVASFRERIAWWLVWLARRIYPNSEEVKAFLVERAINKLLNLELEW